MNSDTNQTKPEELLLLENNVKIIKWEDFEQELARLCSLSSALNDSKDLKLPLQHKLQPLIQARAKSLNRSNELEEMRQKLEARRLVMGNLLMRSKVAAGEVRKKEERLSMAVRSLLVAAKAHYVAYKHLQEVNRLLAEDWGHVRLNNLQKILRMRLQYLVGQVSALYPIKASVGPSGGENLHMSAIGSRAGSSARSEHTNSGPLAILGLQLTTFPLKKLGLFSGKKEIQRSATALGYVAHVVLLIASYLGVPLRYPLRLGGSRSYINDYAPSTDPSSSDPSSNPILFTNSRPTEFPLFLEGQDTTRAAYAVFLLNKDLEQLLNFIGVQSLGPRNVLANLKELLRTIHLYDYIGT
ncbi:hypothetical protein GIB67_010462 [Kingdonia uniflora]|uniref:UV radiation resistance-associated gene protein n=1 Tax=Kingdonia uniflora TaxID=39325 RepID=A0A7J7MAV8_9MAGN|nr:hypothetical protein GIB67_010462 [Kingdonia uniflora]